MRGMATVDPADLDIGTLAMLTGIATSEHAQAILEDRGFNGLRVSHGYVFQHLIDARPTIGELADQLDMTQQGASKIVAELAALGYVERIADEQDARIRRVALSKRGKAAVSASRKARADAEAALAAACGAGRLRTARTVLLAALENAGGIESVRQRRVRPPR
jgi:DNA-binding MarR family transcriptional regulator